MKHWSFFTTRFMARLTVAKNAAFFSKMNSGFNHMHLFIYFLKDWTNILRFIESLNYTHVEFSEVNNSWEFIKASKPSHIASISLSQIQRFSHSSMKEKNTFMDAWIRLWSQNLVFNIFIHIRCRFCRWNHLAHYFMLQYLQFTAYYHQCVMKSVKYIY